jgi:hypothetical protein
MGSTVGVSGRAGLMSPSLIVAALLGWPRLRISSRSSGGEGRHMATPQLEVRRLLLRPSFNHCFSGS